jgi:hypothetical protein
MKTLLLTLLTVLPALADSLPTLRTQGFTGDDFRIEVTGSVTSAVTVEVSPDLANWGLLSVLTPASVLPAVIGDPRTADPRFYRAFVAQSQRLGEVGAGYYDVEIFGQPPRITFADSAIGTVWVGRLRPQDGLFETPTGRDQHVENFMTPLFTSSNGPEWGVDATGASVYFTKRNGNQPQLWRAPLVEFGDLTAAPLTAGSISRLSPLPRIDPARATTRLIYIRGTYATGKIATLDASSPGTERELEDVVKGVSGPRWIPGSDDFVLAMANGQIGRYVLADNEIVPLTNDMGSGPKTDPFAFRAPEMGNEVLIVAIENQQKRRRLSAPGQRGRSMGAPRHHPRARRLRRDFCVFRRALHRWRAQLFFPASATGPSDAPDRHRLLHLGLCHGRGERRAPVPPDRRRHTRAPH